MGATNGGTPNPRHEKHMKEHYKKRVRHECTYHAPTTDEQRQNHEKVNAAVLDLIMKTLIDICPLSPQLDEAINAIKIGRNKANEALAVHVNAKESE